MAVPRRVPASAVESVDSARRASALLNPMRLRLLRLAQEPASATELARRLDLPRQRVNYHVRELARAGFLRPAGPPPQAQLDRAALRRDGPLLRRSRRRCSGRCRPTGAPSQDTASTDYLLALSEQVRSDVSRVEEEARKPRAARQHALAQVPVPVRLPGAARRVRRGAPAGGRRRHRAALLARPRLPPAARDGGAPTGWSWPAIRSRRTGARSRSAEAETPEVPKPKKETEMPRENAIRAVRTMQQAVEAAGGAAMIWTGRLAAGRRDDPRRLRRAAGRRLRPEAPRLPRP